MSRLPKLAAMSYFGDRLAEALERSGITQYRLYKLSGVPEGSISKVIAGKKRPTDEIVEKIGAVKDLNSIGVRVDEMLEWRSIDDYPNNARTLKRSIAMRETKLWKVHQALYGLTEDCFSHLSGYIGGKEDLPFPELEKIVDELPFDLEPLREEIERVLKSLSDKDLAAIAKGHEKQMLKQLDKMDEEDK